MPHPNLWVDAKNKLHHEVSLQLHEQVRASRRFKKVVARHFGPEAADSGWFYEASNRETIRELDAATITYPKYFREAFIERKDWKWKLRLVREETRWLVAADNYILRGKVHPGFEKTIRVLERTADEIEKGKYKELRDARDAMRLRMWEDREPPATQPANVSLNGTD